MLLQKVGAEIDLSMALICCQHTCFRAILVTQTVSLRIGSVVLSPVQVRHLPQTNSLRYQGRSLTIQVGKPYHGLFRKCGI
jgi:hypothetical protein